MSFATNLFLILLGINLVLFAIGESEMNSPMFGTLKDLFVDGTINWGTLVETLGTNAWIYITLIGVVALASLATGSNPLTGGGGHGAVVALQVLSIAIFTSLILIPNFSVMGFPSAADGDLPVLEIIYVIFGAMYVIAMMGLLRGAD